MHTRDIMWQWCNLFWAKSPFSLIWQLQAWFVFLALHSGHHALKRSFFSLCATLKDAALIKCDFVIMKACSVMSEQLTRYKRLMLVKFLISSKCHEAHLESESKPVDISLAHPHRPQGCCTSSVRLRESLQLLQLLCLLAAVVTKRDAKTVRQ